ncbi:unnamed protein product [Lepeophtheirus salmonis]|uniref:(salmon louse) hypothetical protein n=1 Tax=Lepeophtheirus salmonis TaxID=72036 RepID=A0A7R8HEF8_LEPSM|nr:unnamed protein product [Lepeophtheirus salmonis]CAF3041089.1 unnamed protein product [Lepeophtheirus salmonis]
MSKENDIKQLNHSNDDLNLCKKEKMKEYVRKDVKGKKDTFKQVDTTTEDKNSDKCKEKKDYDLVDDSCDDHLNAGIRDASGSIDKEIKVKTDTLSVKEANTIPEDKGTDKSKEKKSYYFVGDSCDDGMDARKGDIYDTMGDEVKGRTDTISVKEPKMTPEDKSSDKCKEKKVL